MYYLIEFIRSIRIRAVMRYMFIPVIALNDFIFKYIYRTRQTFKINLLLCYIRTFNVYNEHAGGMNECQLTQD
jgi:hypothetical protein